MKNQGVAPIRPLLLHPRKAVAKPACNQESTTAQAPSCQGAFKAYPEVTRVALSQGLGRAERIAEASGQGASLGHYELHDREDLDGCQDAAGAAARARCGGRVAGGPVGRAAPAGGGDAGGGRCVTGAGRPGAGLRPWVDAAGGWVGSRGRFILVRRAGRM